MTRRLLALLCLLCATTAVAGTARVDGVRVWAAPDHTRLVFDISAPVEHTLFTLESPDRVVIDLEATELAASLQQPDGDGLLRGLRWAPRNGNDLRVVLDLGGRSRPKSFLLSPNGQYGHRLVVDLHLPAAEATPAVLVAAPPTAPESDAKRDVVVAIDPGHGGEDPGAIGPRGTREKEITLALARQLAKRIDREPGMRALLVRDGDYYISLRKRIEKARAARADLFVSLHADAFDDHRAHGSSVYVLSQRGASSEMARLLAKRENESDLIGGVSLDDKDDLLARVLIDLQQSVTYEGSVRLASTTLRNLGQVNRLHKPRVEKAGFAVLKSPDIPSMLVETAFISNPTEERRLNDPAYQQRMVEALFRGIHAYLLDSPPSNSHFASRRHTIRRGDTLSEIARQYSVSLDHLRLANNLNGDIVRIGQVLRIP